MILRSGENSEDKELCEDWESNDLDASLPLLARDFIVLGRCALSVAADPDRGRPRIRVKSPKNLATIVDPLPPERPRQHCAFTGPRPAEQFT